MKKMLPLIAIAALVAALTLTTGCAGGGVATTVASNQFAGPKYLGFYNEADTSDWGGNFEVIVKSDGSFESDGIVYTSTFGGGGQAAYGEIVQAHAKGIAPGGGGGGYESHEGTVTLGKIDDKGDFHVEAKVDKGGWPSTPLADPYIIVADGHVSRRGFHYEGTGTMKYFNINTDGSRGTMTRQVTYHYSVMSPESPDAPASQ